MPVDPSYRVLDQWHSQPGHVRIVCAGAGPAGLLAAYKVQKDLRNHDFVCYEKNSSIGGTWFENTYPGCACDIPAHAYTYPFEPNPNWSSFYAGSAEILQYFKGFADKYDLLKYINLEHKVTSAIWDEGQGIYKLKVSGVNGEIDDWCHVFINGTGYLNSWKWPKIQGLHDFRGSLIHSAAWDPAVDWTDKSVAVLGTGSSAIQIIPQIQKTARSLTAFMRSKTWISPPVAGDILEASKITSELRENKQTAAQYYYSEEEKKRFRDDPEALTQYRRNFENTFNLTFEMFIKDSGVSHMAREYMTKEMERRMSEGNEDLKKRMIPTWAPGCRRITPGDGYLEALVKPNVRPVFEDIVKVTPEGLIDATGELHEADILVCATGFNIAFAPSFVVKGVNGLDMQQFFDPEPQVYLGVAAPGFPNYFVINGVRGNWAAGTVLVSLEVQVNYIVDCIRKIQEEGIKALEVKQEAVDHLYQHIDEWHKNSVWNDDCKSWYKNNEVGGKLWIWGGSALHYNKTLQRPRFEHYNLQYKSCNMFAFLGNGFTEAQAEKDLARMSTYMRAEDTPFELH